MHQATQEGAIAQRNPEKLRSDLTRSVWLKETKFDIRSTLYCLFSAQAQRDHVSFSLMMYEVDYKTTYRLHSPHSSEVEWH